MVWIYEFLCHETKQRSAFSEFAAVLHAVCSAKLPTDAQTDLLSTIGKSVCQCDSERPRVC